MTIEFKDGRVRVFAPNIQKLADCRTDNEILFICEKLNPMTQVKDQSLRSPELKANIEKSFNALLRHCYSLNLNQVMMIGKIKGLPNESSPFSHFSVSSTSLFVSNIQFSESCPDFLVIPFRGKVT